MAFDTQDNVNLSICQCGHESLEGKNIVHGQMFKGHQSICTDIHMCMYNLYNDMYIYIYIRIHIHISVYVHKLYVHRLYVYKSVAKSRLVGIIDSLLQFAYNNQQINDAFVIVVM